MVLPLFVLVILVIALLIGYPWYLLSAGAIVYLLTLPAGWMSYRRQERAAKGADVGPVPAATIFDPTRSDRDDDRPSRLN
jgi:CDP-diacylglycerol--serine O-phosphatidyltransferase